MRGDQNIFYWNTWDFEEFREEYWNSWGVEISANCLRHIERYNRKQKFSTLFFQYAPETGPTVSKKVPTLFVEVKTAAKTKDPAKLFQVFVPLCEGGRKGVMRIEEPITRSVFPYTSCCMLRRTPIPNL